MLTGNLSSTSTLSGNLTSGRTLSGSMTLPQYIGADYYRGEYEFTPTEDTQTVQIEGLTALENIIINPIPQNYGRIDWNGMRLKVW